MTEAIISGSFIDPDAPTWKRIFGLDVFKQQTAISHPGDVSVKEHSHMIVDREGKPFVKIEHLEGLSADIMVTLFDANGRSKREFVRPGRRAKFSHPSFGELEINHSPLPKR